MNQVSVSVIICAYTDERLKDIHEAVNSILTQTLQPRQVIVAIDHNEGLFDILKSELPPGVDVVLNSGARGLSETRNAGIRSSTGGVVAFIDDDAIAEATWLETLIRRFNDPRVVAVGGRAIPRWLGGERPKWFPEELDWVIGCTYKGLPLHGSEVRNMIGCNMSFRSECFKLAGFFNSEVGRTGRLQGVGEEADICLRISHSMPGVLILYEPEAIIYHKVPSWRIGLRYLIRRSYDEGFYKTVVRRLSPEPSSAPLSVENAYLRYLLLTSIPGRVRQAYRPWALAQVAAIMTSIAATGAGYLRGRAGRGRLARPRSRGECNSGHIQSR